MACSPSVASFFSAFAVVGRTNVSRETFVRRCFAIRLSRAAPRSPPALRCPPALRVLALGVPMLVGRTTVTVGRAWYAGRERAGALAWAARDGAGCARRWPAYARTSQSSSCGGGVAAWRCGGAAGQAPILSSGRPLSRPDRPRRSDWPDPIPSGYSFFLASRFVGVSCSRRRVSGMPAACSLAGGAFRSFRASLGLAASRGALVACSALPSAWVRPGRTDVSRETLVWI